ncbi:MAG: RNA polymerase sigma factor [Limisphaerales bacterium]
MKRTAEAPEPPTRRGESDPRVVAFERWVEDHHERIYAYLRRRSGCDADAVELTQLTFTRAWSAQDRFEGRSSVLSWLHGIAHHVWLDWRRREGRFETRPEAWWEGIPSGAESPDESLARVDSAGAAFAAVEHLDDDLRDTVHLHYYQGLTLAETADALGIASSTVKYRLREALTRLQRAVRTKPQSPSIQDNPSSPA